MKNSSEILSMSPDDLDLAIGKHLLEDEFGMKPTSDAEMRSKARVWFESNRNKFRTAVCSNGAVRSLFLRKEVKTRNELFAAVIDALLTVGGFGKVPVAVLSARLIHYGIDKLCKD